MKPYENTTMKLRVTTILPLYTNSQTSRGVKPHYVHTLVEGHLPGNAQMKYTIIDENHLIKNTGIQEVSIRPLTHKELEELKRLPTTSQWHHPSIQVYKTQYPIDVEKYFHTADWPRALENWVTERLDKDQRLVNCFKSLVIPLVGDPTRIQPLNAHAIWLTNTGTGKSYYPYLYGSKPIVKPTEAGAIGSYDQTRNGSTITRGFLHGEGFPILLDEINTNDKPLIQNLLTYLETGILQRGLKHPIDLRGTKTVILTGNPSTSDDMTPSLVDFITVVCTIDEPARVGRRYGYLLLGTDYKRVMGDGDASRRDEVRRVIETTVQQYRKRIQQMIESQIQWIMTPEPQIEQEIRDYADATPIQIAAEFVRGQSYGCIKKLKMAAIRYIIFEQLDRILDDTVDFADRDRVFQRLLDINRDSWRKLALIKPPNMSDKQWAIELKTKHPSLPNRTIAKIVGVSHTSIGNWLKEIQSSEEQ
ncbi:MAG: hypothetical protein Q6361_07205 [Candidatus Hermodarchaeota archaeon]|nr:hypothetical protein [Candidatus Hermodarchaeota archaeon]